MRYLALIYTDETVVWSEEEQQEVMAAYYAFGEEGGKAGVLGDEGVACLLYTSPSPRDRS